MPEGRAEEVCIAPDVEATPPGEDLAAGLEAEIAARLMAEILPGEPAPEAFGMAVPLVPRPVAALPDLPLAEAEAEADVSEPGVEPPDLSALPPPDIPALYTPVITAEAVTGSGSPAAQATRGVAPAPGIDGVSHTNLPAMTADRDGPTADAPAPTLRATADAAPRRVAPEPAATAVSAPEAGDAGTGAMFAVEETAAPGTMQELSPRSSEARQATAAAPSPGAATASPLVRNVMERLEQLEQSEGRTRLLLRPQGLGILEVEVSRLTDGRLQMTIRAENPMILQSLEQEAGALSEFLGARGFDMAGGGPDFGRYARPEPGSEDETASASESDPAAPPSAPVSPGLQARGQIDITT